MYQTQNQVGAFNIKCMAPGYLRVYWVKYIEGNHIGLLVCIEQQSVHRNKERIQLQHFKKCQYVGLRKQKQYPSMCCEQY